MGKIDRFLSACGRSGKQDRAGDTIVIAENPLIFKTDNLVPKLNAANLQRIVLSGSLILEIKVNLVGEVDRQNKKNDLFASDVRTIAGKFFGDSVDSQIANMISVLREVDGTAIPLDKVQEAFEANCRGMSQHFSAQLEKHVADYMSSNKAIKANYKRYQINCVSSVAINVISIAAWIGVTASSWGATGPVAVVGIVRGCVGIGIEIYNMAIDAEELIKDIKFYFDTLDVLMIKIEEDTKNPKSAVAWNSATEIGLGAIAGLLNVPVPSVEQIGEMLGRLESKLQGIHVKRLALGKEMAGLKKSIADYAKRADENPADSDADQALQRKHKSKVLAFEGVYDDLHAKAELLYADIVRDIQVQKQFVERLAVYKENQKSFSRMSRPIFGFATSVGLSVGTGGNSAEYGIAAMNECLAFAAGEIRDL